MKKRILVLSLLLGLMLMVPCFLKTDVQAKLKADKWEKESNETFKKSTKISVNTTVGGNISSSSDVDCYSFTLKKAGYIQVTFNHEYVNSNNDYWKIYIKNSKNEVFCETYFQGNAKSDEKTVIIGLGKGTYYLQVEDYYTSLVDYTFKVNYTQAANWEKEFNNSVDKCNSIKVNSVVNGTLLTSKDVDWYSFSIPNDGVVWLTFGNEKVNSNNDYWTTTFYSADNDSIYEFKWVGNGDGDRDERKMGLPAGKYYLKVEDYYFSSNPYHFKINYTKSNAWEKEKNDTVAGVNKIKYNTHVYGLIMNSSDVDFYSFTLSKEGYVRIALSHDYVNSSNEFWTVNIYKGNDSVSKTLFKGNDISTSYSTPIKLKAGTYYVKVEDYYFKNDTVYTLAVEYSTKESFNNIVYKDDSSNKKDTTKDNKSGTKNTSKGSKVTVGNLIYKITDNDEVSVAGVASSSVKTIKIPATVKINKKEYDVMSIEQKAFKGNKKLTSVTINADLETIGANAFYGCKKLTSLKINGDVCEIGAKAFYNCKSLVLVTIKTSDIEKIGSKAFYRIFKTAVIQVPSGSYKNYSKMLTKSKIPSKVTVTKL